VRWDGETPIGFEGSSVKKDKRTEWEAQIAELGRDVQLLFHNRAMARLVSDAIRANRGLLGTNPFIDWLMSNSIQVAALTVRRLVDQDFRCLSLVTVLRDLAEHSEHLTREDFVDRHVAACGIDPETPTAKDETELTSEEPNAFFDGFSGPGCSHVCPTRLIDELRSLVDKTDPVRKLVNKSIAHRDRKNVRSYDAKLDAAIDAVGEVWNKLSRLLTGSSATSCEPVIQGSWQRVFREPWFISPQVGSRD
jgi:hypothetical protein